MLVVWEVVLAFVNNWRICCGICCAWDVESEVVVRNCWVGGLLVVVFAAVDVVVVNLSK